MGSLVLTVLILTLCLARPLNISMTLGAKLKGSSKAHVSDGSKVSFLLHVDYGGDRFPASFMTFHPLDGTEVTFVSVLSVKDGKPRLSAPGALGSAWSGCGPLGCSAGQINGGIAESLLDTGVFFSVDPRTAIVGGLKATGGKTVSTDWDLKQMVAFGSRAVGNAPLFRVPSWLLRLYAGTGSPVAGQDSFYTNDNSGQSESDLSKVGPWTRITYPGSRTVKDSLQLVEPFEENGKIVTGEEITMLTDAGRPLSAELPLPASTNAVRFAMGAVSFEKNSHYVVVEVNVTNAGLFEQTLRVRKARNLPCAVGSVVVGEDSSGVAESNAWKNRQEVTASCQSIDELMNPLSVIETAKWSVTALPISARCPNDATGEVYLATQGKQPVMYEWSDGPTGRGNHRKNMRPGKYRVVATDALGASNYEDIEVKSDVTPMNPQVRIRSTKNGLVAVRVYVNPRSRGPYSCKWKNMKVSLCNFTDVPCYGPDEVSVTNGEGCTETAQLTKESIVKPLVGNIKAFFLDKTCAHPRALLNLTIHARNGVPPYTYSWLHLGGEKSSEPLILKNITEGGLMTFNITDMLGSVLVAKVLISKDLEVSWVKGFEGGGKVIVKRNWLEPFRLNVTLLNHVPCYMQQTGRVVVSLLGGLSPMSFDVPDRSAVAGIEGDTILSGGGMVTVVARDGLGCVVSETVEVFPALPFVCKFFFEANRTNLRWYYYSLRSTHDNGVPPILDMWNGIRHPSFLQSRMTDMPAGKYSLASADLNHCVSQASAVLPEIKPSLCPELFECQKKLTWHHSFYVRCLRRLASPLLWNTSDWNLCSARAAFDIVRQIHIKFDTFGITSVDYGAMFVANLLGEAVHKCNLRLGETNCDFPWRFLTPYFHENAEAADLFEKKNFSAVFRLLLHMDDVSPTDLLTVAPYGYDNDPIFTPQLSYPTGLRVVALVVHHVRFPSSFVRNCVFPWSLQVDAELGALFLKHVLLLLQPRFAFPSDNAGIILLHKLGSRCEVDPALDPLIPLFKQSLKYPVEYPPTTISKLIDGHEEFAPPEEIVSECDGLHCISIDHSKIAEAWKRLGPNTYLKREFSEASRGVAHLPELSRLEFAADTVFPRQEGIGIMDSDLRVRIFLQQAATAKRGELPIGARFFSMKGRVLAMTLSRLVGWFDKLALRYITIRDPIVEDLALRFVKKINYTGFGSAWWWSQSPDPELNITGGFKLIDFNARIERHACLGAVLHGPSLKNEACFMFQRFALGEKIPDDAPPTVTDAGASYLDPIRINEVPLPYWGGVLMNFSEWNIQRQDNLLFKRVCELNFPILNVTVLAEPTFARWTGGVVHLNISKGVAPYTVYLRGSLTKLNATGNLTGLTPGKYDILVKDSKGTFDELSFEVGKQSYGICTEIAKCSEMMPFKEERYFVSCLSRLISPVFRLPMPWNDCAMRALTSLIMNARKLKLDGGKVFLTTFLRSGISMYPQKCFLENCTAITRFSVSVVMHQNNRMLKRIIGIPPSEFAVIPKLLVSTSRRVMSANQAAFLSSPNSAGEIAVLAATTPFKMTAARHLKFPRSLLSDSTLASLFVEKIVALLSSRDVVPMDRVAHFLVNRGGEAYKPDSMAEYLQLSSPGEIGKEGALFCDAEKLRAVFANSKGGGVLFRREYDSVHRGVVRARDVKKLCERVLLRDRGIRAMNFKVPMRLLAQPVRSTVKAKKTHFFFAENGSVLSGHVLRNEGEGKWISENDSNLWDQSARFLLNVSYSGFGATEWWQLHDGSLFFAEFKPYLVERHCIPKTSSPCQVFVNHVRKQVTEPIEAGLELYDASPQNFLKLHNSPNVRFFVPENDELYFDSLSKAVSAFVMRER